MEFNSIATSAASTRSEQLFSDKYCWLAGYDGDKHAKAHAAEAKRTASVLRKSAKTFELFLDHSESEVLSLAAQVLDRLGEDLTLAASAARTTKANKIKNERADLADSCALSRWGNSDESMLIEAKELAEFNDGDYRSAANAWLCKRHEVQVAVNFYTRSFDFGLPLGALLLNFSNRNRESIVEIRRCAAEYIIHLQGSMANTRRKSFNCWVVALDDFEAWKARHLE